MQGYKDKVYQRSSGIQGSPLSQAIQEQLHLQNCFSMISSSKQCSLQLSRAFPMTITKQKCKNCQQLQKSFTLLTKQLLSIEKNILEKEENLSKILASKDNTIKDLQQKLQKVPQKNHFTHFSSTFYTETDFKYINMIQNSTKNHIQDYKHSLSLISQKKMAKHSFVSAYNLDVLPHKIRQKAQNRQLNQNVPPNSQKHGKDNLLNRLRFENQTLKNYNTSLLAQIDKLKKPRH